jgi:hypothetical protein
VRGVLDEVAEIALVALVRALPRGVKCLDRCLPVALPDRRNDVTAAIGVVE